MRLVLAPPSVLEGAHRSRHDSGGHDKGDLKIGPQKDKKIIGPRNLKLFIRSRSRAPPATCYAV